MGQGYENVCYAKQICLIPLGKFTFHFPRFRLWSFAIRKRNLNFVLLRCCLSFDAILSAIKNLFNIGVYYIPIGSYLINSKIRITERIENIYNVINTADYITFCWYYQLLLLLLMNRFRVFATHKKVLFRVDLRGLTT